MRIKILLIFMGFFLLSHSSLFGQPQSDVYVIPIKGLIDLGLSSFVRRAVGEAKQKKARCIILELETFGGRVDAATEIRDTLFESDIKTVAFVNRRAISAGALISLACQSIVMAPGSTIGAATPVVMAPGAAKAQPTDEKTISYVRKEFKSTAERNNHPATLAEAMVDPDVEIEGVIEKGKLLTLTTEEALKLKLAEHKVSKIGEILTLYDLEDGQVVRASLTWSENLVRFLTHPVVSGLLLTFGLLGIFFELRIPGWGVSGTIGLICLALFFGAQYMVGLARWTEPLLFLLGVILLALELFVIPGFGVAGVSGILLIVASLFLSLVKEPLPKTPVDISRLLQATYVVAASLIATFLVASLSFRFMPKFPLLSKLILTTEEKREKGFRSAPAKLEKFLGKQGMTLTMLRPVGKAQFGDTIVDVVSEGELIEKGKQVKVIKVEGNRIVVSELG
ncbi:nodulation protein NfeD [bacterium]|nr:nodulation protein NfeD [bacterium]NIN92570.1 nodulation protein NfeD [bacterium]NIO18612.1 nodulation protein NfeD [bacterium]NIO73627.1 nodulation protein NfeD [bacterium]